MQTMGGGQVRARHEPIAVVARRASPRSAGKPPRRVARARVRRAVLARERQQAAKSMERGWNESFVVGR